MRVSARAGAILATAGLAMLAGCGRSASAPGDLDSLLAADRAFAALSREQGAEAAFHRYLAADAVELPAGEAPVRGGEAIAGGLRGLGPGVLDWEPEGGEVAASGDLGYTWGHYVLRLRTQNGSERVSHGKYLTVWWHSRDGWRAAVDMGNSSPAPGS